jgi:enamine deaminase RidA (YjgF/YER057c/UK114 family)
MTLVSLPILLLTMTHIPLVPVGGAKPVGPYVPGLEAGDYVYVSGQGASDSAGHRATDIESQTRQTIANIRVILEAAGLGLKDIVSVQFYLLDLKNLAAAEAVYHEYLPSPDHLASSWEPRGCPPTRRLRSQS